MSSVVVFEIENMFGVFNDGRGIRSDKEFDGLGKVSDMNARDWVRMILGLTIVAARRPLEGTEGETQRL